jgi:hypothetical protein
MSGLGFMNAVSNGVTTGGVLAQLIAQGAADNHLTTSPEVTFWRARVQKCTNFAFESITQTYSGQAAWGSEVQVTLNRTGDLIYWMYVLITIPAIKGVADASAAGTFPAYNACTACDTNDTDVKRPGSTCYHDASDTNTNAFSTTGLADDFDNFVNDLEDCSGGLSTDTNISYAWWVNEIGHAAVQRCCFSIGGQVIDTVFNHYLHMWEELSGQPGKRLTEMVGKRTSVAQLVYDSTQTRRLYVPLPFYFTRHSGNALPLVSLQYHSVQVHVTFSPLANLIQRSNATTTVKLCASGQAISNSDMQSRLDTTYCYLDMEERDQFANGSFQQLITQLQQYTTQGTGTINAQLNFNHPTIELMWALQRTCQAEANNTFNYSGPWNTDPIKQATLHINNLPRFNREAQFFRLKVPYECHTNIPQNFI